MSGAALGIVPPATAWSSACTPSLPPEELSNDICQLTPPPPLPSPLSVLPADASRSRCAGVMGEGDGEGEGAGEGAGAGAGLNGPPARPEPCRKRLTGEAMARCADCPAALAGQPPAGPEPAPAPAARRGVDCPGVAAELPSRLCIPSISALPILPPALPEGSRAAEVSAAGVASGGTALNMPAPAVPPPLARAMRMAPMGDAEGDGSSLDPAFSRNCGGCLAATGRAGGGGP